MEGIERFAELQATIGHLKFANGVLMLAGALLYDGDRTPNPSQGFKVSEKNNRVRQIGNIDRSPHFSKKPVLSHRKEGISALPVQILQQFVYVKQECVLLRHCRLIAVEAVNHDALGLDPVGSVPDPVGKLAGRKFGGIHLLDLEMA